VTFAILLSRMTRTFTTSWSILLPLCSPLSCSVTATVSSPNVYPFGEMRKSY
jgi:hypothetical protein